MPETMCAHLHIGWFECTDKFGTTGVWLCKACFKVFMPMELSSAWKDYVNYLERIGDSMCLALRMVLKADSGNDTLITAIKSWDNRNTQGRSI
jgi:hypothetical protein